MCNIWILLLYYMNSASAFTLRGSSTNATAGFQYNLTCETSNTAVIFKTNSIVLCTIVGVYPNGTCQFSGYYNTNYDFTCYPSSNTYKIVIPGSKVTENLHNSNWYCGNPFGGSGAEYVLHVNVPVSLLIITSTPTNKNPLNIIQGTEQTFLCATNAVRPAAKIQWFLSTNNITNSATSQPDVCNTDCRDDKVMSSSVLTYVGSLDDEGKALYCIAVNSEAEGSRSSDKIIYILYGPKNTKISPSNMSYIVTELGTVGPITCRADCKPNCTLTWSGPNLVTANTSILHVKNIDRNQEGNYQCSARNEISSMTSTVISIVVKYGPRLVSIFPSKDSYTVVEKDSVGPITCAADCKPNCTMTWTGPYVLALNTSVINLQNIDRHQSGSYQCEARNDISSMISVYVNITVNYGPIAVGISPSTQTYTLTELRIIGPITCTADCKPDCMMSWTGPNLPSGITSVLNLRNISRNQSGNYQCTARNSISSMVSVNINIIVNYGPNQANISPKIPVYTVTDLVGSIGPIDCTADCNPECTMSWSGPHVPVETASVLYMQNVSKQQAGDYRCTARNTVGSAQSTAVKVIVEWKPALNDGIISSPIKMGLSLEMFLNITINLIANPIPSIQWTFEQSNVTEDVSTRSNSSFNGFHLWSTLIISSIAPSQFGYYNCFASNIIGNFSQRFFVFKTDLPNAPDFVNVFCTTTTANLMWKSAFDEGAAHHFEVHYWKFGESARTSIKNISDPGFNFEQRIKISDLNPDTQYRFLILAVNDIGSSGSKQVNCTTFSKEEIGRELFYAGIATLATGLVAIIVAVLIVFICRSQRKPGRSDNYIDLNTSNSEKMSSYSTILQEFTDFGTQNKNEDKTRKDSPIYDECQPPTTVNG